MSTTNLQRLPNGDRATVAIPTVDLERARQNAEASGRVVVDVLDESLGLPPQEFVRRLAATLYLQTITMEELNDLAVALDLLTFAESFQRTCLVLRRENDLIGVTADPFDLHLQSWVEGRVGDLLHWHLAHKTDISAFLARQEEVLRAIDGAMTGTPAVQATPQKVADLSLSSIAEDTSPVIKLVNSTIYDALKCGASDIHLEALASGLQVKYRIDGVLANVASVSSPELADQVISRIKVMADLDIAERRVPQDGRFKLSSKGHEIDYRVSVMPSIVNEDVVIRILDKRSLTDRVHGLRIDSLGFDGQTIESIRDLAHKPYGMFLVTGPTGSGKTTTMYAALCEINNGQDKIITIEDPVEYQLPGVLQIPVNEKKGLTFARGLRSILRHDPDKLLVGEIRDSETAQIAIQSALTGHLVFTSVHANNVFDVLGRFLHMGVDTYSFVSALNGILAQRLLRLVCMECAVDYVPAPAELVRSGIDSSMAASMHFRRGRGCGACRGSGYKGRHAIGEVLTLTDELREQIVARASIRSIKDLAHRNGLRLLREAALDLVANGRTTLEEINRVTFVAQ